MKIEKFGTVTEENGTLILDGFVVNGEDVEYPSFEAAGIAIVSAFKEMVAQIEVRSPFWPKNYLSIHSEPASPPAAARGVQLQESLVSLYRYKALPRTVTPGGPIMATITEVFESVADNTRIIIETSNGGASLRAESMRPVAVLRLDLHKLAMEAQDRAEKAEAELAESAMAQAELQEKFDKQGAEFCVTALKLRDAESRLRPMEACFRMMRLEIPDPLSQPIDPSDTPC